MKGRLLGQFEELQPEEMGPRIVEDLHMVKIYLRETDLGDNQPFVPAMDQDEDFDFVQADIPALAGRIR